MDAKNRNNTYICHVKAELTSTAAPPPETEAHTQVSPSAAVAKPNPLLGWRFILGYIGFALLFMVLGYYLFSEWQSPPVQWFLGELADLFSGNFYLFLLAGFCAQMVDGALGMAYGVTATTTLLTVGVPPAAASASVHSSEIFTSGVSGLLHLRFKNVNSKLFRRLLVPGVTGAILGAFFLTELEQFFQYIKGFVAAYTLFLGILIIRKALRKATQRRKKFRRIGLLGFIGGFLDAVGGGGWGPIVSTTLIASGRNPRYTIGSVNLAEFFVALGSSVAFVAAIGITHFQIILGLILGGVVAAPIAAHLSRRLPIKAMMIVVGIVVIIVSLRLILLSLGIPLG